MPLVEIFYSIFWISTFSIIWFYTDWLFYYCQLFKFAKSFWLKYQIYIHENPYKYFPDYLSELSKTTNNSLLKFCLKLVSCPFCLIFWFSVIAAIILKSLLVIAPVYLGSLFIVLRIKKLI